LLREDNADERLVKKGESVGLVTSETVKIVEKRKEKLRRYLNQLNEIKVKPSVELNDLVLSRGGTKIREAMSAAKALKRPEIDMCDLLSLGVLGPDKIDPKLASQIEIELKYEGYINRQQREADQFAKLERVAIPETFDYETVSGLSRELKERLSLVRPSSIGQASRVSGVTPAALTAIMVILRSRGVKPPIGDGTT
jgi:tRNA uridine 5-carboxymethylaminomethyl modification enzyme